MEGCWWLQLPRLGPSSAAFTELFLTSLETQNPKTLVPEPHSLQDAATFTEMRAVGARVEGPGLAQPSRWKS